MHLFRCLFLVTAFHELSLKSMHIPGVQNVAVDAISRNNMVVFNTQVPGATPAPVDLLLEALHLLIGRHPDWTSPACAGGSATGCSRHSPSTGRVYKTGQERFTKFCEEAGLSAYPTSERVLMLFIAYPHSETFTWHYQKLFGSNTI